jgi:hypothetical protein
MNMEYTINQPVIYEHLGGKLKFTGKIAGQSGEKTFIVRLDSPLRDGTKAMLIPSGLVRPLACHWCQDTKKVNVPSFTGAQAESGTIPQKDCPYC